jgi:hypothetical protein
MKLWRSGRQDAKSEFSVHNGQIYTRISAFWWGSPRERDHLEDQGVDGRILRWIFRKWDMGHGLDWSGSE